MNRREEGIMTDRLSGKARGEFFAQHQVPLEKRVVKWYGLSLDNMSKAELRIVLNNSVMEAERKQNRLRSDATFLSDFLPQRIR